MITPRTASQLAYCHGWHARLSEEAFGAPPAELPRVDLEVVAEALGARYAADAIDGWEAAGNFLAAREELKNPEPGGVIKKIISRARKIAKL